MHYKVDMDPTFVSFVVDVIKDTIYTFLKSEIDCFDTDMFVSGKERQGERLF